MSAVGDATLTARAAALEAVAAAVARQGFASDVLGRLRDAGRLPGGEAGFARELALGTIRHWVTIQRVLRAVADYNPTRVAPVLRSVLAVAAYQVVWLPGVPVFAAVDEAVELARQRGQRRATGMVNAILRKLVRAIDERESGWAPRDAHCVRTDFARGCRFKEPVLPPPGQDETAFLAAAVGERRERFEVLAERFGRGAAEGVGWASQATPMLVLQVNRVKRAEGLSADEVAAVFGGDARLEGDTVFLPPGGEPFATELFRRGDVFVQDTTAHTAARAVQAQPGERILDLCAAPGGKSAALAVALGDQGEVVACDVDPQRLMQVAANCDRLGLSCVRSHVIEAPERGPELEGAFDAALVDAPCSNSGVIARRPEARFRLERGQTEPLVALQRRLLAQAAARVRPGGRLVYSTCCLEPAENDEVVAAFLAGTEAWQLVTRQLTLPRWGAAVEAWLDGGFAAVLRRKV